MRFFGVEIFSRAIWSCQNGGGGGLKHTDLNSDLTSNLTSDLGQPAKKKVRGAFFLFFFSNLYSDLAFKDLFRMRLTLFNTKLQNLRLVQLTEA